MKPAPFDYHGATTATEAASLLARYAPDACVLAGGQSLLPELNMRQRSVSHLIDINEVADYCNIELGEDGLSIGAAVRQADVELDAKVLTHCPYLADALAFVASAAVKHRGTIIGSLAHADPSAELPALAVCMDATVHIESNRSSRSMSARDLYTGPFKNTLANDELISRAVFPPLRSDEVVVIIESQRRYNGVALAGAVARVRCDATVIRSIEVTAYGTGEAPKCQDLSAELEDVEIDNLARIDAVAAAAADALEYDGDVLASAHYRQHACGVMLARAIAEAANKLPETR